MKNFWQPKDSMQTFTTASLTMVLQNFAHKARNKTRILSHKRQPLAETALVNGCLFEYNKKIIFNKKSGRKGRYL